MKNQPKTYGPKNLSIEEILQLPKTQKAKYIRSMSREERTQFYGNLFLGNLNKNS
jgi:hypothetical protein